MLKPIVYIVDSDHQILDSISRLLRVHNVIVKVFDSAEDFLNTKMSNSAVCLIVEVNLPKMDGISLLKHINNLGFRLPTIVLSSSNNLSEAVSAMQEKAVDFIEKPFVDDTLINKVLGIIQ